jgi:single-strand DNA-binding protein
MPNLNKVLLMGNLTRDIELRHLPSGMAVAAFGLAVNRRWKNQQGEQQDEVTFVDLEAFGKPAEVMNQYLRKGSAVFIEGRLKLDQWEDKDGGKRNKMKVVVESFQFIDGKPVEQGQSHFNRRAVPGVKTGAVVISSQSIDDIDPEIPF